MGERWAHCLARQQFSPGIIADPEPRVERFIGPSCCQDLHLGNDMIVQMHGWAMAPLFVLHFGTPLQSSFIQIALVSR